uniref:KIB1-4 beta-propeller domain-containing protein n=1 Tax=Leersia perrieri TaxID=77586 RepID=A0A0D9XSU9_9ORYZ
MPTQLAPSFSFAPKFLSPKLIRRRRRRGKMTPDWASLPGELVDLIGWNVLAGGNLHDYVRFRAVCSHWSATTTNPHGRGVADRRFHPRRWMMLPEGDGLYPGHPSLRGHARFLNLSTGAIVRSPHLPLLLSGDHVILDSVDGLLLLHGDADTAIRLLNPLTGDAVDLPPLDSLLPQRGAEENKRRRVMKVCTSIAVNSTGTITVMLTLFHLQRVVAYATAGVDQRWTLSTWELKHFIKPISFQGKSYALRFLSCDRRKAYIYQFNPPCPDAEEGLSHLSSAVKIAEFPLRTFLYFLNFVECDKELLLVAYEDNSRSKLLVYRLADLVRGKIEPIASIGDHTLFLGERSLCVSHSAYKGRRSFPDILPNFIICMHTLQKYPGSEGPARFEQYDLGTGIWTPASDGDIFERPPPRPPYTHPPYLYLLNKGFMYSCDINPTWLVKQDLRFGA